MKKPRKRWIILGIIAFWILFGFVFVTDTLMLAVYIILTIVFLLVTFFVCTIVFSVSKTNRETRDFMNDIGIGGGGSTKRNNAEQPNTHTVNTSVAPQSARKIEIPQPSPELLSEIKNTRNKAKVMFALGGTLLVGTLLLFSANVIWGALLTEISAGLLFAYGSTLQDTANTVFKKKIVSDILKTSFDELVFEPDESLDLMALNFFPGQTEQHGDDFISGNYRGIAFRQSDNEIKEVHFWKDEDDVTHETRETLFFGRYMEFAYNTSVDARTHVISSDFQFARIAGNTHENNLSPSVCDITGQQNNGEWEKINTELETFNQVFAVHTTNPVSAMTALVPSMLESIMRLNSIINRPMAFCFTEDRLHLLICMSKGENAFEAFAAHNNEKSLQKLGEDIQFMIDIMDNLYIK